MPIMQSTVEALESCRRNFGVAPRKIGWWDKHRYLRMPTPAWLDPDDRLQQLFLQQDLLLREGRIVWAHLVQANSLLFVPGPNDHPAVVIYSTDGFYDDRPEKLAHIAKALYAVKGEEQSDPDMQAFSTMLASEIAREMRLPVPRSLTGDTAVFCTEVLVARRHLQYAVLRWSQFPLLIHPSTSSTMILPSRYWAPEVLAAVQRR